MITLQYKSPINGWEVKKITSHIFSAGEVHPNLSLGNITILPIEIFARITSSNDLMELLLVTDILKRNYPYNKLKLVMPYIPYSRQDRVCVKGDSFSLKVFASLINSQGYSKVTVADSHSSVATALFDNVEEIQQWEMAWSTRMKIDGNGTHGDIDYIVSPDLGASKKSEEWIKAWDDPNVKILQCMKKRDLKGNIVETKLLYEEGMQIEGRNFLVVDDIADGSRTFFPIVKQLKEKGANSVSLYVTHGIFSQGVDILFDNGFDGVYTTDSFEQTDKRITVVREFFDFG